MRKEIVEIDERFGKEYAGRYVFQEITWAKRSRIIQKYTRYSQQTGQVISSDFVAIQAETIMASIKEQPAHKPITLDKLLGEENGLPIGLGELFSQIVNRLNAVGFEETAFLSEPSDVESQTKHSQSLGSAKSSAGHHCSCENNQLKSFSSSLSSSTS
jgi:hypothetical protein